MDFFNQKDFIDAQRGRQQRTPPAPPPFPGMNRPGFGPGPVPESPSFSEPRSAPPSFTPSRQVTSFRVDSSSIRNCLGRFTYVWMSNGDEFWMFPIQVSRNTVTGFRWNRFLRWTYFGVSLNRIDAFTCV